MKLSAVLTVDRLIAIASVCLSIFLSIYYGRRGEKRRVPVFLVPGTRELLIRKVLFGYSGFEIRHAGNPVGANGVSALITQFWNDGNIEITRKDVLSPYRIFFPEGIRILDASVRKVSRKEIGVTLEKGTLENQEFAEISFDVLEPGDGLTLQIIYDGGVKADLNFVGSCIGSVKPILSPSEMAQYKTRTESIRDSAKENWPLLAIVAIISVGIYSSARMPHWIEQAFFVFTSIALAAFLLLVVHSLVSDWRKSRRVPREVQIR